jgi:hypothetical protein
MDFDNQLRASLDRKKAPDGFTEGVIMRLPVRRRPPVLAWAAVALAATLLVGGSISRFQDYRHGQHAKRQLLLALEITAEKLAVAQSKIEELNQRSITQ